MYSRNLVFLGRIICRDTNKQSSTCVHQIKWLSTNKACITILYSRYMATSHPLPTDKIQKKNKYRNILKQPNPEDNLLCTVEKGIPLSVAEWTDLQVTTVTNVNYITDISFGGIMMRYCASSKKFAVAKSYMNFLQETKQVPTLATLSIFMKVCSVCNDESTEPLILETFDKILNTTKVFDSSLGENLIAGLCTTSQWKRALIDVFIPLKKNFVPTAGTYGMLICACFKNEEVETGWELLEEMIACYKKPPHSVYHIWLGKCLEESNEETSNAMVKRLLLHWALYEIYPEKDLTDKLKFYYENLIKEDWIGTYTNISSKGICQNCKYMMQPLAVSGDEMVKLKSAFLNHVLKGKDIFYNTTAEELEKFTIFINKSAPFDVVIDGLNVAFLIGSDAHRRAQAKLVRAVVEHFWKNGKSVLVIGRKHMKSWPKEHMEVIQKKAKSFFSENVSEDDPFLLYAALYSGLGTQFVSRDLMRNHLFRVSAEPGVRDIFKRWLQLYRVYINYIEDNGILHIKAPITHAISVQESMNICHIPYNDGNPTLPNELPTTWLCLRKEGLTEKTPKRKQGFKQISDVNS